MNDKEKTLLLELILRDIRANWAFDLEKRVNVALNLATELKLEKHIGCIADFQQTMGSNWCDGRHFRTSVEYGGYEGMSSMHNLEYTYNDKSEEFKAMAYEYITYPEYAFEDWEQIQNTLL
ncbi:hypothetical protein QB910_000121 [Dabrowskivirus KKP3916]|uniref:Phage protein n=1 Tax=Alicyclobacillus phage KKP_3916 TaxID=3040651 RepID=A0AAT9V7Q5_9CAUD|nr:hypothetical protein QB910_000121 [Alicyclobacillus phage KKP 3916]